MKRLRWPCSVHTEYFIIGQGRQREGGRVRDETRTIIEITEMRTNAFRAPLRQIVEGRFFLESQIASFASGTTLVLPISDSEHHRASPWLLCLYICRNSSNHEYLDVKKIEYEISILGRYQGPTFIYKKFNNRWQGKNLKGDSRW